MWPLSHITKIIREEAITCVSRRKWLAEAMNPQEGGRQLTELVVSGPSPARGGTSQPASPETSEAASKTGKGLVSAGSSLGSTGTGRH